jgi:hypothetical protein
MVLEISSDQISTIVGFPDAALFAAFGLPSAQRRSTAAPVQENSVVLRGPGGIGSTEGVEVGSLEGGPGS